MGLPYAKRIDLGVRWDASTPRPVLLSGLRTFVAFYLSVHRPPSGGTNRRGLNPQAERGIGIVEFKRMTSVRIGSPDNEALSRHHLWGSGLESCSAHEVTNSLWIKELTELDHVDERFDESRPSGGRHFILTFYDETIECVAKWTTTRTAVKATMPEVLAQLTTETL